MAMPDINALDYSQLNELKDRIVTRMTEMRQTGVDQLRLRFIAEAAAFGLTMEDFVGRRKRRGRPRRATRKEPSAEDSAV